LHTLGLRACLAAGSDTGAPGAPPGAAGAPPVSLKFLIEGEEEIGSPNLEPFVAARKELLACDAVVVSAEHAHELEGLDVKVEGDRLRYSCRPEELDQSEERIQEVLRRIPPQVEKRSCRRRRGRRLQ